MAADFKIDLLLLTEVPFDEQALVQILACHRMGDKPLSEPMMA